MRKRHRWPDRRPVASPPGQGLDLDAQDAALKCAHAPEITLVQREKIAHTVRSYVHNAHAEPYARRSRGKQ